MGVVAGALDRLGRDLGRPGEAWREASAKSSSAARSFLSQAQRNLTTRRLPEVMVTGAAPPWAARACSVGKRARTSPSSASSAAARTPWPARGRLVKMWWSAWSCRRSMISASSSRSWRLVTWMASSRASTQTARPAASAGPVPGCWGGLQAAEQLADGRAAAVVQAAQEGSEAGLGEGGGGVAGGIAAQERDGGWRVQLTEQPDGAGKAAFQLAGELVDQRDPGLDQVLAGARQRPQDLGRLAVWGERGQAVAVGAQHISQQVGVGRIGLGPAGPIPAAQALDLPRGDHHHAQVGLQHGFHQRTVGAFDRHAGHPREPRRLMSPVKPLPVLGTWKRARIWPAWSTTQTAWVLVAQSIPA